MTQNKENQFLDIDTDGTIKSIKNVNKQTSDKAIINEDGMLSAFGFASPVIDVSEETK